MTAAVFDVHILKHVLDPVGGHRQVRELFEKAIEKCWKLIWHVKRFEKHYYLHALKGNLTEWERLKDRLASKGKLIRVRTSQVKEKPLSKSEMKSIRKVAKDDVLLFEAARATEEAGIFIVSNDPSLKKIAGVDRIQVINLADLICLIG